MKCLGIRTCLFVTGSNFANDCQLPSVSQIITYSIFPSSKLLHMWGDRLSTCVAASIQLALYVNVWEKYYRIPNAQITNLDM